MRYIPLQGNNENLHKEDHRLRSKKGHPGRKYLMVVALLGFLVLGHIAIAYDLQPIRLGSKAIDTLASSFNLHKPFYVVVIDAGSTGSRALAFTFHESILGGNLVLDDELYTETKPGLSAYTGNPKDAAKSLTVLLDKVKSVIPRSEWQHTPLSMRATAGLRLLPGHEAQDILQECRKLFEDSNFQVSKNSISIMDGKDEGIFSWFTVNFLLERFNTHNSGNTVAALDLGGGSTQVTFSPDATQEKQLDGQIYHVNIFNHNMSVYTHSYLGMGLMAARKEILTHGMNLDNVNPKEKIEVRSECINPIIVDTKWNYGGRTYSINGPVNEMHKLVKTQNFAGGEADRPIVNFSECLKIVEKYVGRIKKNKPVGLKDHEIFAFSYYFDRATEVGLVDPFKGGVIQVSAFLKQVKDACDYPNTDQPFVCLDLTFIYVLLHNGFDLEPTTKLYLYKRINGHELSWALGAAFSIIQNGL
ncbi:ectonucleoside triphosphate diphosphohydrolase 5 isoform X2 [Colletes gigas]|uniref:ectonucleoside triphosphate diphosphohydrolase 5 isoform X2 n=1 Tax=Colletes gigas TaxID=935657 RepID=UPI001C9A60E5|nr:ectonucleoside triphosphate diphosphohydrolase 5 isoform X2 [Colletes gigas]